MISSQAVLLLAILASSLTLTCLSLIKSTLLYVYPNLVIFISETSVEFVASSSSFYSHSSCKFTCLQQTRLLQFTLLWHLTNKSQQTSTHSKFGTCHYTNTSKYHTSHQHSKNYIGFLSNKNRLQNLSSHIQNTYKSTTYISLQ